MTSAQNFFCFSSGFFSTRLRSYCCTRYESTVRVPKAENRSLLCLDYARCSLYMAPDITTSIPRLHSQIAKFQRSFAPVRTLHSFYVQYESSVAEKKSDTLHIFDVGFYSIPEPEGAVKLKTYVSAASDCDTCVSFFLKSASSVSKPYSVQKSP